MVYLLIIISFFVGFVLELVVQQGTWLWFQPEWVLLLIFYWLIYQPGYFGVKGCFLVGLVADLVDGALLGKHAFIYVVLGFVIVTFYRRISLYPMLKLWFLVFMMTLVFLVFCFLSTHPARLALGVDLLSLPIKALVSSLVWIVVAQFTQTRKLYRLR